MGKSEIEKIIEGTMKGGRDEVNEQGQPVNRTFNAKRLNDREIDELIGIAKGIVSDGVVTVDEAQFFVGWIESHKHIAKEWPVDVLYSRIKHILTEHVDDQEEVSQIFSIFAEFTGMNPVQRCADLSTSLPLCNPAPPIEFEDREFCLTGKFTFGSRNRCVAEITGRGGICNDHPRQRTNYLVIGLVGSTDWIHSSFGRKIERAVELKKEGFPLAIISEEHWVKYL